MLRLPLFFLFFFFLVGALRAQTSGKPAKGASKDSDLIEFHMDKYTRDLRTNTVKGKGHAYIKKGIKEVWADEVEIDFTTKRAIANGNVHVKEGPIDIWCRHANYALSGDDATLDDATIVSNQLVITGNVVRKLDKNNFEFEEGTYTNCNLDLIRDSEVGGCQFDWKIYGRHLSVTMEEYIRVSDALIYLKQTPIFYLPYFIAPVKTERQSGLLMPHLSYMTNIGTGLTWPYFLALGPWHDLTIDPTAYTGMVGYHLGLEYRYVYSASKAGYVNAYVTHWHFSDANGDIAKDPQGPTHKPEARSASSGNGRSWRKIFTLSAGAPRPGRRCAS